MLLGNVPNTLLCHLKRFDFDFNALRYSKLHNRLEFPMQLNVMPYTKGGSGGAARHLGVSTIACKTGAWLCAEAGGG